MKFEKTGSADRLHPETLRTLEQLVKLHGAAQLVIAIKKIGKRLQGP